MIPAGASQQVRLMLRKPAGLADGEYRSHLWIRPEEGPPPLANGVLNENTPSVEQPAVVIKMLAGVSIPVFVRQGQMTANGTITNMTAEKTDDQVKVSLDINRTGNRSLYGDIQFNCASGNTQTMIYQVNGIAVYTETTRRKLDFTFKLTPEVKSSCKAVTVTYTADAKDPIFLGKIIAQAAVTLP